MLNTCEACVSGALDGLGAAEWSEASFETAIGMPVAVWAAVALQAAFWLSAQKPVKNRYTSGMYDRSMLLNDCWSGDCASGTGRPVACATLKSAFAIVSASSVGAVVLLASSAARKGSGSCCRAAWDGIEMDVVDGLDGSVASGVGS